MCNTLHYKQNDPWPNINRKKISFVYNLQWSRAGFCTTHKASHCSILIYATTFVKSYSSFGHNCHKYISQSVKFIYERREPSWATPAWLHTLFMNTERERESAWGDPFCSWMNRLVRRSLAPKRLLVFFQQTPSVTVKIIVYKINSQDKRA